MQHVDGDSNRYEMGHEQEVKQWTEFILREELFMADEDLKGKCGYMFARALLTLCSV